MEEVYDLGQHPYLVVIHIQKTMIRLNYHSTIRRRLSSSNGLSKKYTTIVYKKQNMDIYGWGFDYLKSEFRDDYYVFIDNFRYELYRVFKKNKEEWNEDDLFLLKAVSDFIKLSVEEKIKESKGEVKSTDQLHYLFVVPSEWEEEIRETLLRPIFIQSNVISANDHNDRLLFCSDVECFFYYLMDRDTIDFVKIKKTIFCRLEPVSESEMLIKLDLVLTVNRLFDFPDSLLFPKVERSNSLSLTIDTFIDGIRALIKDKLPPSIQEEIIQIIMDKEYKEDEEHLKKPLITDTSRWELDKDQLECIESICIFDICSQICQNPTNNIDDLLSKDIIKEYNFFSCLYSLSSEITPNKSLLNWSQRLMTHNRIRSCNKNIKCIPGSFVDKIESFNITTGGFLYGWDVIKNTNIYGKPRILPVKNWLSLSSIFQASKPDTIMNIDISIDSTILSYSHLDENGFVKNVWNPNHFLKDKSLCSLGSFFNFSETTTLNVKSSFICFADYYLIEDASFLLWEDSSCFFIHNAWHIEAILSNDNDAEDVLVSTQQQIYIDAFLLLYMAYIKYVIPNELLDIAESYTRVKTGYNITVEKILLNRVFHTEEGLKNILYASGLINDIHLKKLRITIQEERIMHLLQRPSLALPFPLKSYFVLAQLHENYIQLTLNQVVTKSNSEEENQEAIIIHDRIMHIPNIYTSLCLNMWNNIVEDSNLIKLCSIHQEYSDNDLLEIFSLQNQAEFTENFKQYISKNNLSNNSSRPTTDKIIISLSESCNCRVYITVRDIIDVSFQPVLQDIASLVSASFINKELFGNFWSIKYFFQLIHFDYNSRLHTSLIKMLKETTEDVIIEQGVDIPHYVIPKSPNQLWQPVLHRQPTSYKEFQVGTLHLVHGDGYGFGFYQTRTKVPLKYKSEITNTNAILVDKETVFPLFKKGDMIDNLPTNLTFYLSPQKEANQINLSIKYLKLKMTHDLNSDGTVHLDDVQETIYASEFKDFPKELKIGQDIPILISVLYEAYSGSLLLRAKVLGRDININGSAIIGAPMHLSRF